MVETVDGCFLSVTLSDFTTIGAFGVGAITPFQAVNLCCVYHALCVVFLWLTEVFFFLPCLPIKSMRVCVLQEKKTVKDLKGSKQFWKENAINEKDSETNIRKSAVKENASVQEMNGLNTESRKKISYQVQNTTRKNHGIQVCFLGNKEDCVFNTYERFIMKIAVLVTSKTLFRIMWVLIFLCISISTPYNMSIMRAYEVSENYFDDKSLTREFNSAVTEYDLSSSILTHIILPEPRFYDPNWIRRLKELNNELIHAEIFSAFDWLSCYLDFANESSVFTSPFVTQIDRNDIESMGMKK